MHELNVVQHCFVRRNIRLKTLIRFVQSFIYETSRTHTPIQTDDEEATKALAKAVSRRIGIPTFTSPGYSSGSLGHTGRFIQTLWAQLRTLRTQIGDKYSKLQIPTTHSIVGWAIRHASWILTPILATLLTGKLHTNDDSNDHTHLHCASLAKRLCMPNRRRSYLNTPYDSIQASGLDDARFRMRIWLWMVASYFEPEQYDDFQKDQNDGITKQCNDLQ